MIISKKPFTVSILYVYNRKICLNGTKQRINLAKHGIDFPRASGVFDGRPNFTALSTYTGEDRFITVGLLGEDFITVIWTQRNHKKRIISARSARNEEKREYRKLYDGRN